MSDVSSKKVIHMSLAALREANGHVRGMVDAYGAATPLKSVWPAIARKIGVTERRIRAIWHGEARHISSAEMDALRAASRAASSHIRADILTHADKLDRAAAALESIDPEFHRVEIDRLRNAACLVRRASGDEG